MLLLTFSEWRGPSQALWASNSSKAERVEVSTRLSAFVTRLDLPSALRKIRDYETAYERRYFSLSIEFSLVGVYTIEDLSDEEIVLARATMVEYLYTPQTDEHPAG